MTTNNIGTSKFSNKKILSCVLSCFTFIKILSPRHYCSHITKGETETWGRKVNRLRLTDRKWFNRHPPPDPGLWSP